jgi:GEVED domain
MKSVFTSFLTLALAAGLLGTTPTRANTAQAVVEQEPCGDKCPDLGDAPDSNNSLGHVMSIHPFGLIAQPAFFPTEYTAAAGTGPIHWNAGQNPLPGGPPGVAIDSALGLDLGPNNTPFSRVSNERNAFLVPDQDVRKRNIIPAPMPANGRSNRDGFDNAFVRPNGVPLPIELRPCQPTNIQYAQFVRGPAPINNNFNGPRFVNVWIDFNRDGDWLDTGLGGPCPERPNASVDEWLIRNLPAPNASGIFTLPASLLPDFSDTRPMWLRISIADAPAPAAGGGAGPATGYRFGETEDHLLCLNRELGIWRQCIRPSVDTPNAEDGIARVAPRQPITFVTTIDDAFTKPITLSWNIEGTGVSVLPQPGLRTTQSADRTRLSVVRVIQPPASGQPAQDTIVLGWYGCITCTLRSATFAGIDASTPLTTLITIDIVDADGNRSGDEMVVNIGWQAYLPTLGK